MDRALTEVAAVKEAIARADVHPDHYGDVLAIDWNLHQAMRRALLRLNRHGASEGETGNIRAELNRRVALLADLSGLLHAAEQGDRVALGVLRARLGVV